MTQNVLVEAPEFLWPTAAGCIGLLFLLNYIFSNTLKSSKQQRQLPPGPKPKPVIGNLLDLPPKEAKVEEYWTKHRELYGPISSLSAFGTTLIIINDIRIATELLDKRSAKYSNRPILPMAGGLLGLDRGLGLIQPKDPSFREMRKMAYNQLGSVAAISRWSKEIDIEVRHYLLRVLSRPEDFIQHLRKQAASIILKITYGYNVDPHGQDELVDLAELTMDHFSKTSVPGEWMVDIIPALAYLPEWFPGASFKKIARKMAADVTRLRLIAYQFTRKQVAQGSAPLSIVSETLSKRTSSTTLEDHATFSWGAAAMYSAGADTTAAQMEMFFVAMTHYPDVLRRAQNEIDTIIGNQRLPDENDRTRLPYVNALFSEMIRWEPIGVTIIPHCAAEDDYYEEYFIPKGAIMLAHGYGEYHDPAIYSDPMEFKPERFLGETPEPDPFNIIWGFGRRICPGRHLAVWNLWLLVSRTLAVFDIKAVSGHLPLREFSTGMIRRPAPFKADIKVRSPQHERLIRAVECEAPLAAEGDEKLLDSDILPL